MPGQPRSRPPELLLLVLIGLAAACAETASDQADDTELAGDSILFESPGEEITPGMQAALDLADPSAGGWRSEVLHDLAKPVLEDFTRGLVDGRSLEELELLVTSDFGSSALRPGERELVFDDGTTSVQRAHIPSELPAIAFQTVSGDLLAAFGGRGIHSKVKIFHADLDPDEPDLFGLAVWVVLDGRAQEHGLLQLNMKWRVGCTVDENEEVRIRSVRLTEYEEIQTASELFVELTTRAFGAVPRYEDEFLIGAGEYHFRTDRINGNVFGGSIGMSIGDVTGDGLDDVYVCQHGGLPNRLLVRSADGTVRDASEGSGVDYLDKCQSALIIDLDNDGDQDMAIARRNSIVLAENDGTGHFTMPNRPLTSGPDEITSLAAADYDLDGDVDVYACMYAKSGPLGTTPTPYQDATNGPPNLLWRNDGGFAFENVTNDLGLDHNNVKFSYAAVWDDLDLDGDPDLYVVNDFGRNNLYRNDSVRDESGSMRRRFRDVALEAGADDMAAGMGVTVADFDLDGDPDLYVTNMWSSAGLRIATQTDRFMDGQKEEVRDQFLRHARGNSLLLNNGDGTFTDATMESGANLAGWGWGGKSLDINNDGLPDLYAPNGFLTGRKKDDL